MLRRNHHWPFGILALFLFGNLSASAERRVVVRQAEIRKNPDLYQRKARHAWSRLRRAQVKGMWSLGVPKAALRGISAKMEQLHSRAWSRFNPPTVDAATDLRDAALTLIDQSPLLSRELRSPERQRFAANLVKLAASHGTMMSGRAQPAIGAKLILRALEQTTNRVVPVLEALRTQERQAHDLSQAMSRYYRGRLRVGLRRLIRKMGARNPDLLETDYRGWDGSARQTTALRKAGISVGDGRYDYGRTIYPQVVSEMIQSNTPKKREAALLRYLSQGFTGRGLPIAGYSEQTKKLESYRHSSAVASEDARLVRIYSTEIR